MISVDISNIWCKISLPELLEQERMIFDAHMTLAGGEGRQNSFLGWLEPSDAARRTWINPVLTLADRLSQNTQILVVVGGGRPARGVQAALRLLSGRSGSAKLLFCGEDLSSEKQRRIAQMLEGKDFSVLVLDSGVSDTASMIALRALKRMLEARYPGKVADHITVAAGADSPLGVLAGQQRYSLLHFPDLPGAKTSCFSPAGLLMMAVGGISPGLVFSGAAEMAELCDDRSFDNPVWLYAGGRSVLAASGLQQELLCTTDPAADALGMWWSRVMSSSRTAAQDIFTGHVRLPEDLYDLGDSLLQPGYFASILHLPPSGCCIPVESDWDNADGLNGLAGQQLQYVEKKTLEAVESGLSRQDIPFFTIECNQTLTDDTVAQLLYFAEFSAELAARLSGGSRRNSLSRQLFAELDDRLGRQTAKV